MKEFNGNDFKNTVCQHPFLNLGFDYDVPMLEGDFVIEGANKNENILVSLLRLLNEFKGYAAPQS